MEQGRNTAINTNASPAKPNIRSPHSYTDGWSTYPHPIAHTHRDPVTGASYAHLHANGRATHTHPDTTHTDAG